MYPSTESREEGRLQVLLEELALPFLSGLDTGSSNERCDQVEEVSLRRKFVSVWPLLDEREGFHDAFLLRLSNVSATVGNCSKSVCGRNNALT